MDKLEMKTADLTGKNINKIGEIFPNVITESKDKNGNVKKAVDFDLLRQVLSDDIVEDSDERYRLDWPGKKASLLKANTPITKTLRPCREESVDFDNTENLYIEGDNFEVLKILQESYLGKVKMIYIDPPYNTGNDFIYKDDFKVSKAEYDEEIGTTDEEGGRLFKNTDSNGRYHSDWLSMMYERLIVARDFLKDDGVIFMSIGEQEVHNLRKISDEIFGEANFIGGAGRISKKANNQGDYWAPNFDHVLTYCKNREFCVPFFGGINYSNYTETETDGPRKGEKYQLVRLYMTSLDPMRGCSNQRYYIECPDGSFVIPPGLTYPDEKKDGAFIMPKSGNDKVWRWSYKSYLEKKDQIVVKRVKSSNLVNQYGEKTNWNVFTKTYLEDVIKNSTATPNNFIEDHINQKASHELKALDIPFDFAKPTSLIEFLSDCSKVEKEEIILDFFAGSSSTAHATMKMNLKDGGKRKYIMIQLNENLLESSDAFKEGYKTISEIAKERIRRAGKKILEENAEKLKDREKPLDIGFRVYKTDTTNMKDVFYHPFELNQKQLELLESNIKEDRTPEDLLTQVILDLGLELSLPIEEKVIHGNNVYIVQTNALVACFDNDIDFKIVDEIAKLEPLKVVFKDAGFKDDKDRINVEERFKRLSPETRVSVI